MVLFWEVFIFSFYFLTRIYFLLIFFLTKYFFDLILFNENGTCTQKEKEKENGT